MSQQTTILHAVFALSRANRRVDAGTIGAATGVSPTHAARVLVALERQGLVDASRARLTMLGLARAVASGASGGGHGVDLDAAERAEAPARLPLAAAPAAPEPTLRVPASYEQPACCG